MGQAQSEPSRHGKHPSLSALQRVSVNSDGSTSPFVLLCDRPEVSDLIHRLELHTPTTTSLEYDSKFQDECSEHRPTVEAILDELKEIFEQEKEMLLTNDDYFASLKEVEKHPDFEVFEGSNTVYYGIWKMLAATPDWNEYEQKIRRMSGLFDKRREQEVRSLVYLYPFAVISQNRLDMCIRQLAIRMDREDGFITSGPKSLYRAWQKVAFRTMDEYGTNIRDLARVLITFDTIERLHDCLILLTSQRFCKEFEIEILTVHSTLKPRHAKFSNPWQDVKIHLWFYKSVMPVICEVQLCHERFMSARKNLGGHESYEKFRGVLEMKRFVEEKKGENPAPEPMEEESGCCVNFCSPLPSENAVSHRIDRDMQRCGNEDSTLTKLLLLGTGNAGKSTFLRQFKLLYCGGIHEEERKTYVRLIHGQCIRQMQILAEMCDVKFEAGDRMFELSDEGRRAYRKLADETAHHELVDDKVARAIKVLWGDEAIRNCFEIRSQIGISESSRFFFNHIDRIARSDFLPTDKDIILMRSPTPGVASVNVKLNDQRFRIVDVGGQKSERKKWVHVFDDTNVIIWVASMSAYDEVLFEDLNVNAMEDQLKLFGKTITIKEFINTPVILFLNKSDLFEEKLMTHRIPLTVCEKFADFRGGFDLEAATMHIRRQFKELMGTRTYYDHVTVATETQNVQLVFNEVAKTAVIGGLKDVLL